MSLAKAAKFHFPVLNVSRLPRVKQKRVWRIREDKMNDFVGIGIAVLIVLAAFLTYILLMVVAAIIVKRNHKEKEERNTDHI